MNKTLLILIAGIVLVAGLIGYTFLGKSASETAPHDDTGTAPHDDTATAHHDDTGTSPHND